MPSSVSPRDPTRGEHRDQEERDETMKYREVLSRTTGFSVPMFGVSWNPPQREIGVARQVLAFLEDRRVLYNPYHLEVAEQCIRSVAEIRRFLTKAIRQLPGDSRLGDGPVPGSIPGYSGTCRWKSGPMPVRRQARTAMLIC